MVAGHWPSWEGQQPSPSRWVTQISLFAFDIHSETYEESRIERLTPLSLDSVVGCAALGGVGALLHFQGTLRTTGAAVVVAVKVGKAAVEVGEHGQRKV